jgi:hypothetical protein
MDENMSVNNFVECVIDKASSDSRCRKAEKQRRLTPRI